MEVFETQQIPVGKIFTLISMSEINYYERIVHLGTPNDPNESTEFAWKVGFVIFAEH